MNRFILLIIAILISIGSYSQNFFFSHNGYEQIKYGYLYNGYIVDYSSGDTLTSSDDWSIPTKIQYDDLITYVSDNANAIKTIGTRFWSEDRGQTNHTGFSAKGAGNRTSAGVFANLLTNNGYWSSTIFSNPAFVYQFDLDGNGDDLQTDLLDIKYGLSIRLVSDATGLSDGQITTYTGNDGTIYKAIVINELYWLTDNLVETKYRNGTSIPEVTINATWAALTSGARCVYNNNESNR